MEQLNQKQFAIKKILLNTTCKLLDAYGNITEYRAIDTGYGRWQLQRLDGKVWVDEVAGKWSHPDPLVDAFERRRKMTANNLKDLPFRTLASKKRIEKSLGL